MLLSAFLSLQAPLLPPKEEKGKTLASGEESHYLDPSPPGHTLLHPHILGWGEVGTAEELEEQVVSTHLGMLELQLCQLSEILTEGGDPASLEVHELWGEEG